MGMSTWVQCEHDGLNGLHWSRKGHYIIIRINLKLIAFVSIWVNPIFLESWNLILFVSHVLEWNSWFIFVMVSKHPYSHLII